MTTTSPQDHPASHSTVVPSRQERLGTTVLCSFTLASVAADSFLVVAQTWLLTIRGQAALLGALLATLAVVRLVAMPVGGVIADRYPRARVLTVTSAARAALAVAMGVVLVTGLVQVAFVVAGMLGLVSAVHYPADRSVIVDIVDKPSLAWANGWLASAMQVGQIVGPLVAGALIALVGPDASFAAAAGCYALASVILWFLRVPRAREHTSIGPTNEYASRPLRELGVGLRIVVGDRALLLLIAVIAVLNVGFIGPFAVGVPALVHVTFGLDAQWFTAIQVAFAAGSLVGALLAARVPFNQTGPGVATGAVATFIGVGIAALAPAVGLTIAFMAIAGLASGLLNVGVTTVLQRATSPQYMGRVMSFVTMAIMGLGPVSQAAAGAGVALWGGRAILAGGAAFSLVVTAAMTPALIRSTARVGQASSPPSP